MFRRGFNSGYLYRAPIILRRYTPDEFGLLSVIPLGLKGRAGGFRLAVEPAHKAAAKITGLLLLNLAVMLLGWGVDDLPGFFHLLARSGFVVIVVLHTVVAILLGLEVQAFPKGPPPAGRWSSKAWMGLGFFLMFLLPYADRRGGLVMAGTEQLRYWGVVLYAIGGAIRLLAAQALGKHLSAQVVIQEGHRLVQAGVYGLARHPIYLGLLVSMVGLPLVFRSWLVFPMLVMHAAKVHVRIGREEKLLREHFGDEFEDYSKRTRRLIPYIY